MSFVRAVLRWIGKHQLGSLLSVFTAAFGILCFIAIADEVSDGDTRQIDRIILLALRSPTDPADPLGGRGVEEMGRDLTALGGVTVLSLLTFGVLGYLLLIRKPVAALFVTVSVLGALALSSGLKDLFERPRPDLVTRLSYVVTSSFPSGHSMLSASVYLTLGALLARMQANLVVKAYILLWAVFLACLVGVSRVYVGVHWPTDVLAGWSAGAAWAAGCWLVAGVLQRRGRVEPPAS